MQTDEAETQLNKLKKEFTAYRMDMEKKVAFQEQVKKLSTELKSFIDERLKTSFLEFHDIQL